MENTKHIPVYITKGTVIHGRGIGKLVGMPTANLKVEQGHELPTAVVYIAKVLLDGRTHYGITHIGTRPTVDSDRGSPQRFDNLSLLLEQIIKDCISVREFWGIEQMDSCLRIDVSTHSVKVNQREIFLSRKEFDLLYFLYANPDATFTKKQLYEAIWHEPANDRYHAVENTVFQIRKKLNPDGESHDFIKTVVGYGYKINLE